MCFGCWRKGWRGQGFSTNPGEAEEQVKAVRIERLIDDGVFSRSREWALIESHITSAIAATQWPPGSGRFVLYDERGKERGRGNGVKPIKQSFMNYLESLGWEREKRIEGALPKGIGKVDARYAVRDKWFCLEWETGNISSSHRALNKMSLGMLCGALVGGALILPTRSMYKYLTDRVGNFAEIEPYFPLWRSLNLRTGLLVVIAVEHDAVSRDVPRIPKGTDGRALR